jgi:hypothetical protein
MTATFGSHERGVRIGAGLVVALPLLAAAVWLALQLLVAWLTLD